ncbi:MAG TPA: hypothetical protein VFV70_15635 [Hyphomonadaceae bacterium]|nr:hypothetical protein [Hyphomonadaceae bacterium]
MDEFLPYIFNAYGGLGFTSLMCALMRGNGLGFAGNTFAGIVGGLAVGAAVQAAGLQNVLGPDHTIASYAQDLLEGALGGCVLAMVIELIKKSRTHA